jgi:membrane-associated PAP2 superfamily phosphatase
MTSLVSRPAFLLRHLYLPALPFLLLALALEYWSADLRVADWIYQASGASWSLRDAWLTRTLVHEGGRQLVAGLLLLLLLALISTYVRSSWQPWRRGLWYLLVSALLAGLAVNLLKRLTHVDCPWDLLRYGGEFPYQGLLEAHPHTFRTGACFPAGHASAGYAWLGLYYLARDSVPRWRNVALGSVLLLGLVFGIGQQLRGAHFVSHDLWTLGVCWAVVTLVYAAFGGRLRSNSAASGM